MQTKVYALIGNMKNKLNDICIIGIFSSYEAAETEQLKIESNAPYFDNYYIESFTLNT